ncbi:glutathione peroxidase [Betaproteobacteria bacterium]|nr:glutathione peroxidase [Betaproteobacteria bacterium]
MLPEIDLIRIDGKVESLADYNGKTLLIVNVASNCGFTPQYRDLQQLYLDFNGKGLEVLAFPCNQFGAQEPGNSKEIQNFCTQRYAVTFPVFSKIDVNGANEHKIYTYLKKRAPGVLGTTKIKWNFTKFIIDNENMLVKRYAPQTPVIEIRKDLVEIFSDEN